MTDVVLNVKSLVVKNHSESTQGRAHREEHRGRGHRRRRRRPTTRSKSSTRDHVIATLTDDVPFVMEMVVENGRGYVPATEHSPNVQEIGIIPVDAVYSPVVRVRYEIEETRVGQKTNYDKLTMEIWTNGSIGPEMALVEAAKILRKHLNPFVQYNELGSQVRSPARGSGGGIDAAHRSEVEHEPGRAEALGAGDQLPGIGKHHHRARSGSRAKINCSKSATSAKPR